MTEGRVVAAADAAAGSYLVQDGQGTHNSAQDDLDARHGGSVEEVVEVYCVIVFRLALLLRHAHSWCVERAERDRTSTSGWVASVCPETPTPTPPTSTPRLAKLSPRVAVQLVLCLSEEEQQQVRVACRCIASPHPSDTWKHCDQRLMLA